jgi:2-polyprenyl-3-methyl-5-hydroxy-6-metoxy-1,4-benzoquinol methylase
MVEENMKCRICSSNQMKTFKSGSANLNAAHFKISDSNYGETFALSKCINCGLVQTTEKIDLDQIYSQMEDPDYVASEPARAQQARDLLSQLGPLKGKSLLDFGAASGILVSEAAKLGALAIGVEKSRWLVEQAERKSRPVTIRTLTELESENMKFDVITLVDVIEHVDDPLGTLIQCERLLRPGGKILLTTPDHASIARQLFRAKWWHYRAAHITYFSLRDLNFLAERAGFEIESKARPKWYFSRAYFFARMSKYLPFTWNPQVHATTAASFISLNLFDSWSCVMRVRP